MQVSSANTQKSLVSEGFETAQLTTLTRTASTLSRLGARFAAGDGALAEAVRRYQDLFDQREVFEDLLLKELNQTAKTRMEEKIKTLRMQLDKIQSSLKKARERLENEFPAYAKLARPSPLSIDEVKNLLTPEEALLTFVIGLEESYLWVIRHNLEKFLIIKVGKKQLTKTVTNLRQALVPQSRLQPFDLEASQRLYNILLKPAEAYLKGANHLLFVPNGPLESLPMGLLVKQLDRVSEQDTGDESVALVSRGLEGVVVEDDSPEEGSTNNRFASYRKAQWLAQEYAITMLPSVSSLKALRGSGTNVSSKAPKSFMGFGDPLLGGVIADNKYIPGSAELFSRGAVADVKEVRQLPRLPETDKELRSIARTLGAPSDSVYLREDATESKVKSLDLSQSRILAFATHGLVSGEMKGLAEPALVFTPPEVGTEEDDGLLTASEVAQLKLDADWVILSACNTASSDGKPGAEGLSGLARSFFYAGGRSLLVSHWPVETNSAVELTTGIFEEMKTNPEIGRAEALRRSRIRLINNQVHPEYAHPYFWAPFVVVGEGGRIQTPNQ
jgi:CHAT domain-containing protein